MLEISPGITDSSQAVGTSAQQATPHWLARLPVAHSAHPRQADHAVWVVIPAYNEAASIGAIIKAFVHTSFNLVVVDDGSTDATDRQVRQNRRAHLCRHSINLGQGAALQTGIRYALRQGARYVVTFDADGQHSVADVPHLLAPLIEHGYDVTLGDRFGVSSNTVGMPSTRRWLLGAATAFTRVAIGMDVHDTHNGLRAFTAAAAAKLVITQNRMGHASQILKQIRRHRFRFCEVPVSIRYTAYSLAKGQSSWNAVNILWESLRDLLRT